MVAVQVLARHRQEAVGAELEALPGMNIRETFENKVSKALNDARDAAGTTTQKSLKDLNNAVTMASSGSCTIVMPPPRETARSPADPSSMLPLSTTPITRGP